MLISGLLGQESAAAQCGCSSRISKQSTGTKVPGVGKLRGPVVKGLAKPAPMDLPKVVSNVKPKSVQILSPCHSHRCISVSFQCSQRFISGEPKDCVEDAWLPDAYQSSRDVENP